MKNKPQKKYYLFFVGPQPNKLSGGGTSPPPTNSAYRHPTSSPIDRGGPYSIACDFLTIWAYAKNLSADKDSNTRPDNVLRPFLQIQRALLVTPYDWK
jgi:hypothetical protein